MDKGSGKCLEQLTENTVEIQKQPNEITRNFPSSSRAVGVELPGQWSDIHRNSKKPSKSTRTKKKSSSKTNGENVKGDTQ